MRNHQEVIDTANGTIKFPHVEMMLAMTDEMKNCNPQTIPNFSRGESNATFTTNHDGSSNSQLRQKNNVTGVVQPLPQFEKTAIILVAPSLATTRKKRINIRIAKIPEFPYTIKNHTLK